MENTRVGLMAMKIKNRVSTLNNFTAKYKKTLYEPHKRPTVIEKKEVIAFHQGECHSEGIHLETEAETVASRQVVYFQKQCQGRGATDQQSETVKKGKPTPECILELVTTEVNLA